MRRPVETPGPFESSLRSRGLRVTRPRITVLDVLTQAGRDHEHPTTPEILDRARERLDSLSTQAVYDCLEALTEAGLLRRIQPAGSPARYETRVGDNHHHVVCRECGALADVDCTVGAAPCLHASGDTDFVIDEAEVVFWGLCTRCTARSVTTTAQDVRREPSPL